MRIPEPGTRRSWSLRQSLVWKLFKFTMVFKDEEGMRKFNRDMERALPRRGMEGLRLISLDGGGVAGGTVKRRVRVTNTHTHIYIHTQTRACMLQLRCEGEIGRYAMQHQHMVPCNAVSECSLIYVFMYVGSMSVKARVCL